MGTAVAPEMGTIKVETPHGWYEGPAPTKGEWTIPLFGICKRTITCGDTGEPPVGAPGLCPPTCAWCHDYIFGACERFGVNAYALMSEDIDENGMGGRGHCYNYAVLCC